jgi:hypothetical protein
MALSALDDKSRNPDRASLDGVLGKAAVAWHQLVAHVERQHAPIIQQWSFSSAKYGWSLRLRHLERVVLYLTPQEGRFLVGVVLGEKAATAAHERGLHASVLALIDDAPRYAEGRGIRVTVTRVGDLRAVRQLVALKMAT